MLISACSVGLLIRATVLQRERLFINKNRKPKATGAKVERFLLRKDALAAAAAIMQNTDAESDGVGETEDSGAAVTKDG